MVFTTVVNFIRSRGPDEFWRKRKIFKLAAVRFLLIILWRKIFIIVQFFRHMLAEDEIVTASQFVMFTEL